MSFPFFPLLSPWKAGLTPSLLPSCFMEGDWLVEAWFLRQHAKQWSVTEYSPHHWSLMSSVSLSRLLNLFISKETSQKRLLKRDFSKERRGREERKREKRKEHYTHSPLLAMSLTSLVIGPWSMGRGRKRREKGKEGEEGRRGGEKGTLRPTGLYYFPVGAKGAHARPSTSSRFGAGLSCWKPRRSRGFPHDLTGSHKSQFQTPTQNERARGPLSTLQTAGL